MRCWSPIADGRGLAGSLKMEWDEIQAELSLLVTQMENQPQDRHEIYLQLREKLNGIRAMGMPLPDDLVRLERELEAEFAGKPKD